MYNNNLESSESLPAIDGGYLYIYKGKELLAIVSIPRPNLLAERSRDSIVENDDYFTDEDGNEYSITIQSSMYGIDWFLTKYPDDENIISQLRYEVKYNEYWETWDIFKWYKKNSE